jgi:hypothetical protein
MQTAAQLPIYNQVMDLRERVVSLSLSLLHWMFVLWFSVHSDLSRMFNVADNFYSSSRKLFVFKVSFLCLLKSSQTFGIEIAVGKMQPVFWLQYTLVGAEPDPLAWFP